MCALSLQCTSILKLLTVSPDDCFAACKLNCYVRGWRGMSALLRGLTLPISSRTMSCSRGDWAYGLHLPFENAKIVPYPAIWRNSQYKLASPFFEGRRERLGVAAKSAATARRFSVEYRLAKQTRQGGCRAVNDTRIASRSAPTGLRGPVRHGRRITPVDAKR